MNEWMNDDDDDDCGHEVWSEWCKFSIFTLKLQHFSFLIGF